MSGEPLDSEAAAKLMWRMLERREKLLQAVLLFHRGGPWTADDRRRWKELTGRDEATTKAMCDAIREAV